MLARLIATVAALLLACASPQAQAYVRAPERVSVSFADLARADALENTLPAKSASNPKTALPARATLENLASGKNAALSHWHVCKNWSPAPKCTSTFGVTGYQKEQGNLYQAVARFYRPGTATFLSQDPWEGDINNPASLNPYIYGYGNPGIFIDSDGRTPALSAVERDLSRHRMNGLRGVGAARDGLLEAPWYAKPGLVVLGAIDVAQTMLSGGAEAAVGGANVGANTLISGMDRAGFSEAIPGLATAAEQSNAELNAQFDVAFPAYDAARENPGAAAWNAIKAPFTSAEKAILENNTEAQIALGQQAGSLSGALKAMAAGIVAGVKKGVHNAAVIVENAEAPGVQMMKSNKVPGSGAGSSASIPASGRPENVYQHRDADGKVNYYGISCDLPGRACDHRNDSEKTGETMEQISDLDKQISDPHGTARTLEAKLIRRGSQQALLDGLIDGTESVREQLAKAGLLNKNRGREESRWVPGVEIEDHIIDPKRSFDIRTPKPEQ